MVENSKKVDVLFINPGDRKQIYQSLGDEFCAIEPPVFPGLFATYLRKKDMVPAIIDGPAYNMSAQEIAEQAVHMYDAELIVLAVYGFQPSASTQNMGSAGKIAKIIKELDPDAKVMMTGTHPAALPERTMQEESVDFVCDLEGPVTIWKTTEALKSHANGFTGIPSLWWRDGGKIMPPSSPEPLIMDLDEEMPGIAWDLLPMDKYRSHNWHSFDHIEDRAPYAAIHTSLGCPYKCSFCCINAPFGKPSYRRWSPERVVEEIDFLVENYGIKNIKFVDEMFVLNKRHVLGICDLLIERNYDLNIWAYARVDTVQDEFLEKLRKAGFRWLCLGIESASDHVRDGAEKKYSNNEIVQVVRDIQNAGIHVIGNFIFGLPDDSEERMRETEELAIELNCEFANFYSAMAYPGSPLYTEALQKNIPLPKEWHHYSQHGYDCLPLSNNYVTGKQVVAFRDRVWNDYFHSEKYLDLVKEKFGQNVVDHINRMTAIELPRNLEEPVLR